MNKELSIQEKARRYNEVIEVISKCETDKYGCIIGIKPSDIFPELKESEDEQIKQALIRFHKSTIKIDGVEGAAIVAWLEKQGEQKSSTEVEPKFKDGDWVVDKNGIVRQILSYKDGIYKHTDGYSSKIFEDEWRMWTIQDAKDGDVLVFGEQLFLFKRMNTSNSFYAHCNYHFIGYDCLSVYDGSYSIDKIYPATEEQRYLLFQKIKEAGYEWSDKDRKLIKIVK